MASIARKIVNAFGFEINRKTGSRRVFREQHDYRDLERLFGLTEGMISFEEAKLLYDMAASITQGVIVEIGSYRGRSTVALAAGSRSGAGAEVYAVDPHESFVGVLGGQFGPADRAAFFQTMLDTGAYENVRLVNLPSEVVACGWTEPVGFLWIDGDHSLEGVTRDYECWRPHLLPDALLAFDDSTDPEGGPFKLIESQMQRSALDEIETIGKIRVFRNAVRVSRGHPARVEE